MDKIIKFDKDILNYSDYEIGLYISFLRRYLSNKWETYHSSDLFQYGSNALHLIRNFKNFEFIDTGDYTRRKLGNSWITDKRYKITYTDPSNYVAIYLNDLREDELGKYAKSNYISKEEVEWVDLDLLNRAYINPDIKEKVNWGFSKMTTWYKYNDILEWSFIDNKRYWERKIFKVPIDVTLDELNKFTQFKDIQSPHIIVQLLLYKTHLSLDEINLLILLACKRDIASSKISIDPNDLPLILDYPKPLFIKYTENLLEYEYLKYDLDGYFLINEKYFPVDSFIFKRLSY